jgi:Flp pilus assembly protein TadD
LVPVDPLRGWETRCRVTYMSEPKVLEFTLPTGDFDQSLLPPDARVQGTTAFREAVRQYLQDEFTHLGGWSQVEADDRLVKVSWTPNRQAPNELDQVIAKLERGEQASAIMLLQLLLSDRPADVSILYNLGMALSDVGRLDEAELHLRRALDIAPDLTNARVALGVALQRHGRTSEAIKELREAVKRSPDNPWAQRNLGACLLSTGQFEEAESCLRKASLINPDDQQASYGLGQALGNLGKTADADAAYRKVIDVDEYSPIAERARDALRGIAQKTFRDKVPGVPRPDAVMYCLGAMERFEKMSQSEVQRIAFEIAMLGRKGLDVNDPEKKYRLKSLPGEYSGLQLVSMMYVGFKIVAPEQDVGFDLSKEYAAAKSVHGGPPEGG